VRRVLYLSFLLAAGCARTAAAPADPGAATVVEVVDGDTVVVDIGGRQETLRLIGVDTSNPASVHLPVLHWFHARERSVRQRGQL